MKKIRKITWFLFIWLLIFFAPQCAECGKKIYDPNGVNYIKLDHDGTDGQIYSNSGDIELGDSASGTGVKDYKISEFISIGYYDNNLATALSSIGYASHQTLVIDTSISLAADANISDNIAVYMGENGNVTLGSYNLYFHGDFINPPNNKSFTIASTGRVYFRNNVEKVYPEWFGAVGDGSTDDRLAIDYAIDSYNYLAFISNKNYFISQASQYAKETLLFGDANDSISWIIEGNNATITYDYTQDKADDLTDDSYMGSILFKFDGSQRIIFKDLVLNGSTDWTVHDPNATPEYAQGCGYGIEFQGCSNVLVSNVRFLNFAGDCIYFREDGNTLNKHVTLENCEFNTWGRNAITCYGNEGLNINKCIFESEHSGSDFNSEKYAGIYIERDRESADVSKVIISENKFTNNQWGIYTKDTYGGATNYPIELKINNNFFYDQNYAIYSQYTNDLDFSNNTIQAVSSNNLVYLFEVINGIVSNNIMRGTGSNYAEIIVYGRSTGTDRQAPCLLSNNIFYQGRFGGGQHLSVKNNTLRNIDVSESPLMFSASINDFSNNYLSIVNDTNQLDADWLTVFARQINNNCIYFDNNSIKKGDFYKPNVSVDMTSFSGNYISGFEYAIEAPGSDFRNWAVAGNCFDSLNNEFIAGRVGAAGNSGSYLKIEQSDPYGAYTQRLTKSTYLTVASSATWSNAIAANYRVIGVTIRVDVVIAGAASFDIGDGTDQDRWGDDIAITQATTTDYSDFTDDDPIVFGTAKDVVLTPNGGAFSSGNVRVTVHYEVLSGPTT